MLYEMKLFRFYSLLSISYYKERDIEYLQVVFLVFVQYHDSQYIICI